VAEIPQHGSRVTHGGFNAYIRCSRFLGKALDGFKADHKAAATSTVETLVSLPLRGSFQFADWLGMVRKRELRNGLSLGVPWAGMSSSEGRCRGNLGLVDGAYSPWFCYLSALVRCIVAA